MNLKQKLYDLLQARKKKFDAAKAILLKDGKTEAYDTAMGEMQALDQEIEAVKALIEEEEKAGVQPPQNEPLKGMGLEGHGQESGYEKAVKSFAEAARNHFKAAAGTPASEGTPADGGYTVPQDISTRIIQLRDSEESLLQEVTVIPVTTNKGSRTRKKRSDYEGFKTVAEAAKIGLTKTPAYEQVEYNIEKRTGILPVTRELLADSDANIAGEAEIWLAGESRVTANNEILAVVKTFAEKDLTDLDGIRKAWMGLDPAFRSVSKLITNTDGMTYLATLKDKNGRDLLTPNPTDPAAMQLACGPYTIPVKEYANKTIPTGETNKVPFFIGSMKDAVWYWDRQQLTIEQSDVAVAGNLNAFEQDLVLWKGGIRDDCTKFDDAALINGYITVAGAMG